MKQKWFLQTHKIYSSGSIRVDDRTIKDHDGVPISGSLETIIAKSGNVAMVKIAQMINEVEDKQTPLKKKLNS